MYRTEILNMRLGRRSTSEVGFNNNKTEFKCKLPVLVRWANKKEGSTFTGFSRVSPFNGPNVIKHHQQHMPLQFLEPDIPSNDLRYRYSSNDLRTPPENSSFEYSRRGSEGYNNANLRKPTPFPNQNFAKEFTVMTLEQNINLPSHLNYMDSNYLNGNRGMTSDDEENETGAGTDNFVDESEDVESKKSSAGSSTRDSGVSSLKSAGRMLPNDSPPSTGDVENVEIPDFENEDDYNNEHRQSPSPKTSSSRSSRSVRSPTVTDQVSRASAARVASRADEEDDDTENIEKPVVSKHRPVENSPPPTPRPDSYGERPEYLRKPVLITRSSSKKKLASSLKSQDDQRRASTSPMPQRRTQTPAQHEQSLETENQNGRYVESRQSRNGNAANYRTDVKTPDLAIEDFDDDVEEDDGTDSPSGNSRESTSSRVPQPRLNNGKLPVKCTFLKKGLTGSVIPAPVRRVYKGSFRESNSQARAMTRIPSEVFPQELKPLDSPKHGLSQGMQKLSSPEWETNIEGFRLIVRLIRYNQEFLLKPPGADLHNIILSALKQLGNLRSQVCRAACLFFKELFTHLDFQTCKPVEQSLEKILEKLLDKSMDTNKFIREDSGSALDSMVLAMPPQKCINTLDNCGTRHRNAIVRKTTARLAEIVIKKLGAEKVLSEFPEKTLPMLVRFLQEGNLETRTYAKASLSFLATNPSFDTQLRRYVPHDLLRHSDKAINNLRSEIRMARRSSTHRL